MSSYYVQIPDDQKRYFALLIFAAQLQHSLKCHFWFPGIFKVFGKTDVDNRIIEATIKKPFLARGTLNLKTNGLNEKKWQQKTVFVVNSEWPANFITKQLIAIATKLTSKLEQQNQELHIVWKLLKMSYLSIWILAFSTNFCQYAICSRATEMLSSTFDTFRKSTYYLFKASWKVHHKQNNFPWQ